MKCDTSDLKFSSGNVFREARELSSFRRYKEKKTPLEVNRYDEGDILKTRQTNSIDRTKDYASREEGGIQEPKMDPFSVSIPEGTSFYAYPTYQFQPSISDVGGVPDCHIAAGVEHLVLVSNNEIQIRQKFSAVNSPSYAPETFFSDINEDYDLFDPRVIYDHYEDRFIIVYAAKRAASNEAWIVIATSEGPDAFGGYYFKKFRVNEENICYQLGQNAH